MLVAKNITRVFSAGFNCLSPKNEAREPLCALTALASQDFVHDVFL